MLKILELLKAQEKTQKELATYLNITPQAINNYVKHKSEPDIATIKKIASFFHVSIDYLLNNQQPETIDITALSNTKKDCIQEIQSLNEDECKAVLHFIAGLKQKEFIYKRG